MYFFDLTKTHNAWELLHTTGSLSEWCHTFLVKLLTDL